MFLAFEGQGAGGGEMVALRGDDGLEMGRGVVGGIKEVRPKSLRTDRAKRQAGDVDGNVRGAGAGGRVKADICGPISEMA